MNDRRWYPSCTTLGTGDVLVTSGLIDFKVFDELPQVWQYTSPTPTWRQLDRQPLAPDMEDYPWMHVLPDGKVFHAGDRAPACHYLNTTAPIGQQWTNGPSRNPLYPNREGGASVMYLPGKAIAIGGGPDGSDPTETAEVIDLTVANPAWQTTSMANRRRHLNATLLADGKVLVTGGTASREFDNPAGAVRVAELWKPPVGGGTGSWTTMAEFANDPNYRGYHATALLLADGRVLSGGGNNPPISYDPTMEIFSPPYLYQPNSNVLADRPTITSAPLSPVTYGVPFNVQIQTTPAHTITRATFLRLGSVTHSVNFEQRFVELAPPVQSGGTVQVTPPANSGQAPPGYYILFLINAAGVPSVGAPPKAAILRLL